MELKAEYRREAYRNYVIFNNQEDTIPENKREENYEIPMLLHNKIPYLLDVHITYLNERARYAYDITSNQAIFNWIERRKIKNRDCEYLYSSVFGAIDACCEYLLDEKNLILLPEYIYYDLGKNSYGFIYHVHYQRDILQQTNELSEFLMDHIDYEDERAVLLVYAMYHESKRKEASIDTLRSVFQEKKKLKEKLKESQNSGEIQNLEESHNLEASQKQEEGQNLKECELYKEKEKEINQEGELSKNKYIKKEDSTELTRRQLINRPIMEIRQESEKLVSKYPVQSYSVVGVTLLVMLIIIVYSISQGLELKKMIAVILIVASITAYIGSKMFDPKNKVERMIPVVEYIKQPEGNPFIQQENIMKIVSSKEDTIDEEMQAKKEFNLYNNTYSRDSDDLSNDYDLSNNEDLSERTQLLSIVEEYDNEEGKLDNQDSNNCAPLGIQYVLLPEDDEYKQLKILDFPFYIGKITDGMDAVIMESTISRVHAKITQEAESFYITDMGSTNGTFINEENIQPHSRKQINIGDILRFANVSYKFSDV